MPLEKATKFWDRVALRYSKSPVADEDAYQRKLEITRQYLKSDMVVLEFGCGTGSTALANSPYVKEIQAIDFSLNMIQIAQEKAASSNVENVTFKQANINELSISDQSFDVVMGHSILHLLENKSEVISKVYRILKSGGIFVSSTMCLGDSFKFKVMKFFVSIGAYFGLLPTLSTFTTKELLASLVNAGFEIDYQWQPKENSAVFIVAKKP